MKLILARHGEAEDISGSGMDRDRKLTQKGREECLRMGKFIRQSQLKVSYIYHSTYTRARETAEIYAKELGLQSSSVEGCDFLTPSGDYDKMLRILKEYTNSSTILIVGHNPEISFFSAKLIQGEALYSNIPFSPGTTLALNVPWEFLQRGQIIWMLSPYNLNSNFILEDQS